MCSRAERWNQGPSSPSAGTRGLGDASALSLGGSVTDDGQGPGPYVGHTPFGGQMRPSYAPFNSTNVRVAKLRDEAGPAPGAYDPKPIKGYDSGLPKKHVPFASGAKRLDELKSDSRPGPGQYQVDKMGLQKMACRTMGAPGDFRKTVFRSTSAPSIPVRMQSFGYEEASDGRLVRQGPKTGYLSGGLEDSAGPGQYDVRMDAVASRARGGKMLGGAVRDPAARGQSVWDQTPGPGHYGDPDKSSKAPVVVSSFVSQTPLGGDGPKAIKKVADTPGPGHYAQSQPSRPTLREQHPELQYFGSTAERFGDAPASRQPGPGAYAGQGRAGPRGSTKGTMASGDRFEHRKEKGAMPGPGHYQPAVGVAAKALQNTASLLGSTGNLAFGSHEARLRSAPQASLGPGPGAYGDPGATFDPDSASRDLADGRRRTYRQGLAKGLSSFKSNTAQDALVASMIKDGMAGPPPGAYSPMFIQDTGAVMRLPPKGEGFGCAAPRLAQGKEASGVPGPGWYQVPVTITAGKTAGTFNRLAIEGVPERGKARSLGFATSDRRFADGKMAQAPGPGEYHYELGMNTRTFNVHFGDLI